MKRIFVRAAFAALAIVCGGHAQAVPIEFSFSGSFNGQLASAQFTFESEGLRTFDFSDERFFTDLLGPNDRPSPMRGTYTLGGDTITMSESPIFGYGNIVFVDTCTPICVPFANENWQFSLFDQSYPVSPVPGDPLPAIRTTRSLTFESASPFDFSTGLSQDYFDRFAVTPESVLTLPLLDMRGIFQETTYDCSSGDCTTVTRSDQFVVDSVTRRVIENSVPEPGTLALFSAALAMLAFVRRPPARTAQLKS
jgi:hypothetical protein